MQEKRPDNKPVHENIILFVITIGVVMASIDSTIVLLAFPAITSALKSNFATILWVILIYILVTAVLSLQLGRVGDIFGRGRMYNLGFAIFTVASLLCGLASTAVELIIFRSMQAVGGALLQSTSTAIIADIFKKGNIGRAFGFTAIGWSLGAVLGIILGGFITTFLGYQYIFFINVPIGILAFFLGVKYLKDNNKHESKIDIPGMILLGIAITLLVYGGIDIAVVGLTIFVLGILILGIILLLLFILNEKKSKFPTIDFVSLKNKIFRNSLIAAFFQSMGFIGATFMLIMYLQGVKGYTPFFASLLLVPGYIISAIVAPKMGRYSDKYGARELATIGIGLIILGIMVYLYTVSYNASVYLIVIGSGIVGIGGAMFYPANSNALMSNSNKSSYGSASGLLRLFSNMGLISSFVIVIVAAASAIPSSLAFQIFVGSSKLTSIESAGFITGMQFSLLVLIVILIIAGIASATRGKHIRVEEEKVHRQIPTE
ncbi:MAG: MFS transporter [Candidatus Micrarchaeia archaeon]